MHNENRLLAWSCLVLVTLGWLSKSVAATPEEGLKVITPQEIFDHVRVLSSDEYEGRAPASPGEDKTIAYLTDQFHKIGLKPGNPDGTYVQNVPVMGFTPSPTAEFTVGDKKLSFEFPNDYVAYTHHAQKELTLKDTDVVFVGYGVVAPEYGWDDYKDVDVRGKTIVMLVNDPAIPDPTDPSKLDESMFRGKAMTYYGRWMYKYEIAAAKGAAAAIIVHETGPAAYPYAVVVNSNSRETFDTVTADGNAKLVPVQGWMTLDKAIELSKATGHDFWELKKQALKKDFRPISLGAKATFTIKSELRQVNSRNGIAKIEGSDPKLKDEYVIYSAHWDHLGKDTRLQGDQIYNGAADNASGTAGVLAIAKAFVALKTPPKRTVLFFFPCLEEKGLIGAHYYANNPLYPLEKTLADINKDGLNPLGATKDVVLIGDDNSSLVDLLKLKAAEQGRVVKGDPKPEKGSYYRSDHFEFAKVGVPAIDTASGVDFVGKPEGWGLQRSEDYTTNDYHKPSDEIKADWTFEGGALDAQLLFAIGYDVANDRNWPQWKQNSEFKAKRDAMALTTR